MIYPNCMKLLGRLYKFRLRNSAEVLVLGSQLCTQIWVRATIDQLKKAFVLFVVIANQVEGKFETHFR